MTRRTLRWRIGAVLSTLIVATGLLVSGATTVSGAGVGTFVDMGGWWKDPACGTSAQTFVARLWKDTNMTGESWKFCSDLKDFCWAPHGADSSAATLCDSIGADGTTANDYASSLRISAVSGGATCAVAIYENKLYGGARVKYWDAVDVNNLAPWPADALSSIRREC